MTELSESILAMRELGKTYKEIQESLGCSKGTISYHLGEGQKSKTKARIDARREEDSLEKRIYGFRQKRKVTTPRVPSYTDQEKERFKYLDYSRRTLVQSDRSVDQSFDVGLAKTKIRSSPVCYLTGRKIDLSDLSSYHLDHIVPVSRGGKNTLENLGLTSKEANRAKGNLTLDEFLDLCYEVLKFHDKI